MSYIFIDNLVQYIQKEGFEPRKAVKFQRVNAQDGKDYILSFVRKNGINDANEIEKFLTNGIPINTIASDGTNEANNIVNAYKTVLNNVGNTANKWSVDTPIFKRKYEPAEQEGVYKPKGNPMLAYGPIRDDIEFNAPWGEKMRINAGGFILQDTFNENDIYGISRKDFVSTYTFV